MPHETLPADIAAAIDVLTSATKRLAQINTSRHPEAWAEHQRGAEAAHAELVATILRHLRGQTETRDALVTKLTGG